MSLATALFSSPLAQTLLGSASTSAATAKAAPGAAPSSSSKPTNGGTDALGSTFLSLLVQELQNQDPTAPMDSTAMVGQMISLNQLNQLTSINQVLSGAYGAKSGSSTAASSPTPKVQTAAHAALHLLSNAAFATHPAVASSVTLPAL